MIRLSALYVLFVLSVLSSCQPVYAGYTVHVDSQRQEFVQVNGPYGPETYPATAETPPPPTYGAELCRPDNYSPFAAEPARRTRVFSDNLGIATLQDILAVCPDLKKGLLDKARASVSATLAQTDYMVIKEVEIDGYTMPAEVKAARQALRDKFNSFEQAINAATSVEDLLAIGWEN